MHFSFLFSPLFFGIVNGCIAAHANWYALKCNSEMKAIMSVNSNIYNLFYHCYFTYMFACIGLPRMRVTLRGQKRCQTPWRRNYKWLWVIMSLQGTQLRCSGRTANALNYWAISSPTMSLSQKPLNLICLDVLRYTIIMNFNIPQSSSAPGLALHLTEVTFPPSPPLSALYLRNPYSTLSFYETSSVSSHVRVRARSAWLLLLNTLSSI